MNKDSITGDIIGVYLRQLGATKIQEFNSRMHIVEFDLGDGWEVSYVFNITKNDKYFLQRMRPYAIAHGKFSNAKEIIEFIRTDIAKFKNAKKSHNFSKFLEDTAKGNELVQEMEHLFLNHNVDPETLDLIQEHLQQIIQLIRKQHKSDTFIEIDAEDIK